MLLGWSFQYRVYHYSAKWLSTGKEAYVLELADFVDIVKPALGGNSSGFL